MLFDRARRYQGLSLSAGAKPRDIDGEHRRIMEAVLARDVEAAVRLLDEHVALTAELVARLDVLSDLEHDGRNAINPAQDRS